MINSKKIIIYGTTDVAAIVIKSAFFKVAYIIDNDNKKWGECFHDIEIFSPEKINEEDPSSFKILLAFSPAGSSNSFATKQLIEEYGLIENQHFVNIYEILPNDYPYQKIIPTATYAPWKSDKHFLSVYGVIKNYTLVDIYRCYELWSLVEQVSNLDGALIEIGVWKGGTGGLIAKKSEYCGIKDTIYLCDTFNGVVKANPIHDNAYKGGEHSDTSVDVVKDLIYNQLALKDVKILSGIFPNETHTLVKEKTFRFCHIDVDVYESAKEVFEWVWDKMVIGGIVVFDDFGFNSCQGITKYVNELSKMRDAIFLHNINGHGILIKQR